MQNASWQACHASIIPVSPSDVKVLVALDATAQLAQSISHQGANDDTRGDDGDALVGDDVGHNGHLQGSSMAGACQARL